MRDFYFLCPGAPAALKSSIDASTFPFLSPYFCYRPFFQPSKYLIDALSTIFVYHFIASSSSFRTTPYCSIIVMLQSFMFSMN